MTENPDPRSGGSASDKLTAGSDPADRRLLARSGRSVLNGLSKFGRELRDSSLASQRQFADVDHARRCLDRNFEMICLYDVRNVARAVRDNVDAGSAS